MKILLRTLIILLAAAVVTGGTLGAMQVPAVQTWIQSQSGHGGPSGMTEGEFTGSPMFTAAAGAGTDAEVASSAGTEAGVDVLAATSSDSTTAAAGAAATAATGAQTRPMRGEGDHNSGGNLAGLVEVAKNFVIVLAVSLVIGAAGWVSKRFRPHRPASAAA